MPANKTMPIRLAVIILIFVAVIALLTFGVKRNTSGIKVAAQSEDILPAKVFDAQTYTLDNGLEIIVIPNDRVPVVTHMVWYKVGAADEPRGLSGIAHFLEHLMFKGSQGLAPGEFSEIIRGLGGNDNAFTSQDYTAYYQSVAKEHLPQIMKMEAGRMRGMNPPEDHLLSERNVIQEERVQRTDNDPAARLTEQMRSLAHVNHPYAIPVIGWMHEIKALEWPDIKAFYDQYYGPNNAILIVSGDVTGEEVYALAQNTYGPIPMVQVPQRTRTAIPPMIAMPSLTVADKAIRQPSLKLLFRVPSTAQNQQDSLALQILEDIAGASSTSRLYQSLVVEQKIVSNIALSYRPSSLDQGELWINAFIAENVDPETVYEAIKAELNKLIAAPVTNAELKSAKQRMQDSTFFALDSLSGPAMIIGRELTTGATMDYIETWPHLIETVTAEQIQNVAKRFLNLDDRDSETFYVRGTLLPETASEEETPAELDQEDTSL